MGPKCSTVRTVQYRFVAMSDGASHIVLHKGVGIASSIIIFGVSRFQNSEIGKDGAHYLKHAGKFAAPFASVVDAIMDLRAGENVLIFCEHGVHRSPFLAGAVVMASAKVQENGAVNLISLLRPAVQFDKNKTTRHMNGRQALDALSPIIMREGNKFGRPQDLPLIISEQTWKANCRSERDERRQPTKK